MKKIILVTLIALLSLDSYSFFPVKRDSISNAKFIESSVYPLGYKEQAHLHYTRDISAAEALSTAFLIQFVYIGGYVTTQWENIQENGSFKNWRKNITNIHFDKDSYDYNIITHIGNAHYSYLFYRAAGYKKMNAFAMTVVGSTIFEFLIETVTEPPSIQDLWQTPVLGTLLGITNERIATILINSDHSVLNALAYVFNPFLAFDQSHYQLTAVPILDNTHRGIGLSIKF